VDNVNIALRPGSDAHHLSPGEFDLGHFMFVSILDLMTSPSTCYDITIWRCVPTYLVPDTDNRIHDFVGQPRDMHHFTLGAAVPRPLLRATTNAGAHYYSFYGYIGNLLYYFNFDIHRTINNVILADPVQGNLHIKVEGILQGDDLPSDGVTTWTWFQREDAPTRNGGGDVTRLMEGPGLHAKGPGEAQCGPDVNSTRRRPRSFLPPEGIRK
jgi:hypothetical protein